MSAQLQIQKALWYEQHRKDLLARGEVSELRQTYDQQKEFLPDQNTGKFWDEIFTGPQQSHPMEKWRIQHVLKRVNPKAKLLNVGVGQGKIEELLIKKYPKIKYTGTDITRKTLRSLQKKYPQWKFQYAELLQLPFPKNSFDQVFFLEVLEHIKPSETFEVLSELVRVLKPGGELFLSVPVNEGLEEMLPENPNSHMRMYSKELLSFELETAGLQIQKILEASAFAKHFRIKHFVNQFLGLRHPNNLLAICQKPKDTK